MSIKPFSFLLFDNSSINFNMYVSIMVGGVMSNTYGRLVIFVKLY